MLPNAGGETWKNKWAMIESRRETCLSECLTGHRTTDSLVVRVSVRKCRDAIEALAQDLWALRDWLVNDPSSGLKAADVDAFLHSAGGYHIRACGDLATRAKHFAVNDNKKHLLQLQEVKAEKDGVPIVFKAVRIYHTPADKRGDERVPTGSTDEYEDAVEMCRRALEQWRTFLVSVKLLHS
ncbi:MAG: hypothetical protein E6Q76_07505 [Rhizobium sp.]|nr:MAG: hypothetical protein E6Q76_07505 [Rhizobium sp.]